MPKSCAPVNLTCQTMLGLLSEHLAADGSRLHDMHAAASELHQQAQPSSMTAEGSWAAGCARLTGVWGCESAQPTPPLWAPSARRRTLLTRPTRSCTVATRYAAHKQQAPLVGRRQMEHRVIQGKGVPRK